eukprot:156213_1
MSSLALDDLSGHATFYGDKALADWAKLLLWTLNGLTTIITICNVIYLRKTFPKVKDIPSKEILEDSMSNLGHKLVNKNINDIIDLTESLSLQNSLMQEQNNSAVIREDSFIRRQSRYRGGIQKYFYVVSVIPCCVSYAGHYGARFPEDASWIFPGMNIAIGIGFLAFIRMMVMSCEGWNEIKKELIIKPDECESCKTRPMYKKCCRKCCCKPFFLKENAYEGIKQRILFCCLILVKPVINYIAVVFEIDYHSSTKDQRLVAYAMKTLTMFTTFIPLNVMRSFHGQLLPYTRLRRSGIKRTLVGFLAPVCQLQEVCIQFIWARWAPPGFEGIDDKYKWCCIYGIILVVEMTIISMIITFVAYRPKDLRLWEYSESFLKKHGYKHSMKDEEFLFGKNGIIDNIEEHVPKQAYVQQGDDMFLNTSMDSRISVLSNNNNNNNNGKFMTDLRTRNNAIQ